MGIEIGKTGRPPQEAIDASKAQSASNTAKPGAGSGANPQPTTSGDQLKLSDKASQLKALEAEISNLPVVDTQRVQDVQRTIATGSFEIQPARVANKLLTFEAGLGKAS
ncbi:MAG: flagellar biosynthesis anti-sigma factor FlgM [Gammaproteobacteria bacterium]|nr:flagellar biosynthesis anti-sigma factor FlgM [Gammaproteobacteria bacterium]